MAGDITIGYLKRLTNWGGYLAGQLKSAVSITGGTISGVTLSGQISANTVKQSAQVDAASSTTLAALTGLVQTVVPGTYYFRANISGTSTGNGGFKLAFKYTTTALSSIEAVGRGFTATGVAVQHTTTATDQASLLATTSAVIDAEVEGTMVVTTGGTVQLQFAQNASSVDTSSAYIGSTMTFTRIA